MSGTPRADACRTSTQAIAADQVQQLDDADNEVFSLDEHNQGPLKRRRLELEEENICLEYPCFHLCHYQMLKSLYDKTPYHLSENADDTSADGALGLKLEQQIEAFLNNRLNLLQAKKESQRWKGIHEEADQLKHIEPTTAALSTKPSLASSFSPASSRRSPITMNTTANASSKISSFSIVAHVLGARSNQTHAAFLQQTAPYRPLVEHCQQRLHRLMRQNVQAHQNNNKVEGLLMLVSDDTDTASAEQEQSLSLTRTYKIRLWKLLLQDLQHVL
jgi:hypothetical protein